jgi:hypothetical protein
MYKSVEEKENDVTFQIYKSIIDILPTNIGTYSVYADNYYGSLKIAQYCEQKGIKYTFACRQNQPAYLFCDGY